MAKRIFPFLIALTFLTSAAAFAADTMPLSQVHKGMRGYGETVFEGNKLERFDVEIIGVLTNIAPGQSLILARVDAPMVQRAGIIAGMSGSPVYIDGKVIGALSYGWQFAKEPVAGITPIESMLQIARAGNGSAATLAGAAAPRMNAAEFLKTLANHKTTEAFQAMSNDLFGARPLVAMSGAKPIATPLSLGGFGAETIDRFGKTIEAMGFMAVPTGSTTGASSTATSSSSSSKTFKAGDAIGAILLSGDFSVAATGTVTHVDGDHVYAFGHPFLDLGEINFPMAKSEIIGVMPSLATSFKFANTGEIVGALSQDRGVGIMGTIGVNAQMIPIDVSVEGSGAPQVYHLNIVRHPQLSPLILAMAADAVVTSAQRGAGERTVMLDSEIKLKNFAEPIRLREGWAGAQARQSIPAYLAVVAQYVMSNEFRDAEVERITLHLHHDDNLKIAKLLEASIEEPQSGKIHPGDTVKVRTLLKPFRGEAFTEMFDVKIPDNQPVGPAFIFAGSGSLVNQIDFSLVPPDPRTLEQVLAVLKRLRPSTDLTLGLYTSTDGAVAAGVYFPNLPPTMRAVVSGDTTNGAQAAVRYHSPDHVARSLGYIVDGAMKIDIDVKPQF